MKKQAHENNATPYAITFILKQILKKMSRVSDIADETAVDVLFNMSPLAFTVLNLIVL